MPVPTMGETRTGAEVTSPRGIGRWQAARRSRTIRDVAVAGAFRRLASGAGDEDRTNHDSLDAKSTRRGEDLGGDIS